jgi:uncharacterized membrane-anchored protein
MQSDTLAGNPERKKAGFPTIELVGWATPPRYDAETKKLYWAKELRFEDNEVNTLNYNIRILVLGRSGVLVLNAVADIGDLDTVEKATPEVLAAVDFTAGNRHQDFDPSIDKVAAYGIGALIAGKVAAKAGLFKVILGAILAAKKVLIVAGVAIAVFVGRLLGRKKKTAADAGDSA